MMQPLVAKTIKAIIIHIETVVHSVSDVIWQDLFFSFLLWPVLKGEEVSGDMGMLVS